MPIDLYRNWPSARRSEDLTRKMEDEAAARREIERAEQRRLDGQRPTVFGSFDPQHRAKVRAKAEKRQRADNTLIAEILSGLVLGQLVGLRLPNNLFSDARSGFFTALQQLGATVRPPAPAPNSANRTELRARALGVSPESARRVQSTTPRSRLKFDEFAAQMVGVPDLQAALDAGNADGLPAGIVEAISALLGAVRGAVLTGDRAALELAGSDFGSLAGALMAATSGATTQRSGYRTVRKVDPAHPRGAVVEVEWPDGRKTKTRLATLYQNRKG